MPENHSRLNKEGLGIYLSSQYASLDGPEILDAGFTNEVTESMMRAIRGSDTSRLTKICSSLGVRWVRVSAKMERFAYNIMGGLDDAQ
jgi:hypothetical protein